MHGYLSEGKSFAFQLPFFGRDFNVFAPDLKGFGSNCGMERPYSLDDYVEEVREYIYKNGLKNPHVVAHSFGARVALKAAYLDCNVFSKMVLTGAAGMKPRFSLKKSVKKAAFKTLKRIVPKDRLTSFYSKDYLALDPVMRESFLKIVNEHLDGVLPEIFNPVLIIVGDKDRDTPIYQAKKINRGIKNSRLLVIKDAGHFAFIDKSAKFNTEVKEFLLSDDYVPIIR